jgi:hypothetical protein
MDMIATGGQNMLLVRTTTTREMTVDCLEKNLLKLIAGITKITTWMTVV